MTIKVPDNFRPSDYDVEISIPKPDMECRKNEDGSFSLYARYNCDISDIAREAAREMYEKMEADLMDELLRLNGYVPERTCKIVKWYESVFPSEIENARVGLSCGHLARQHHKFCPECGAKVIADV